MYVAGPGLVFVVYPEALAKFPVPQLWSVMFFAMLLSIGVGSQVKRFIFSARLLRPGTSLQTVHSPERYIVHLKYSADLDCSAPCLANSTGNRKPSHLVVVAFYCHLVSKKKGIRRWATETEIIYFHFVGKLAQYRF